jgi:GTP cyclohydrolase II
MARAITDGSGVLVCLTHEGDCHGKEESKEEIREKEEVTESNPAKIGQEEDRRRGGRQEA